MQRSEAEVEVEGRMTRESTDDFLEVGEMLFLLLASMAEVQGGSYGSR
jgi:hypothetical protein